MHGMRGIEVHYNVNELGECVSKHKYQKIELGDIFEGRQDQTVIRPHSITLGVENRGKDFKVDLKVTYKQKEPLAGQEWSIKTTLHALQRIQENLGRLHKYFYYQVKEIKKGYELMLVSDDAFAMIAGLLTELLAFGVRSKDDMNTIYSITDAISKWTVKSNMIDE